MDVSYQPLRVPSGWRIDWNTFYELDPTEENVRAGYFGGLSMFCAIHEQKRLCLSVEWRPEDDPDGEYQLQVEVSPWLRTERGRRRNDVPLDFSNSRVVHEFRTRSRDELVREIEDVFRYRPEWVEGS